MNKSLAQIIVGVGLSSVLSTGFCVEVEPIETGDPGICYTDYSDPVVIANLRRLGLEPVTAHGAVPNDAGDDTDQIQEAIFTAMEQCMNAEGASPQGVPSGANNRTYIDGCKAVFFPPGEYWVSDTIKVMQPLLPVNDPTNTLTGLKRLELGLDGYKVTYMGEVNPEIGNDFRESGIHGVSARRKSNVLIGSTCEWGGGRTRPVIKAISGFDSACPGSEGKPIVQFWAQCRDGGKACDTAFDPANDDPGARVGSTRSKYGQANVLFNNIFRNIDIDAGVGPDGHNTAAIGIEFPGAQGSVIEDTEIIMTNGNGNHGEAGMKNMPGQSGGIYNVTVVGGKYGLWTDTNTRFGMAVGVRFFNQTDRAILHHADNKLTVIGFHIKKSVGEAIEVKANPGGSYSGIAMVDGVIDLGGNSSDAVKVNNRPIYLKNVQIKSSATNLVTTGNTANLLAVGTWTSVDEWAYSSDDTAFSGTPRWMEDGIVSFEDDYGAVVESGVSLGTVPGSGTDSFILEEFVDKHLWDKADLPSFEDPTSRIILAQTYTQNTPINTYPAFAAFRLVDLPRVFLGGGGRHPIDETLVLDNSFYGVADRNIAGLDRVHTVIESRASTNHKVALWCPPDLDTPMIKAQNSENSTASFGRVSLAEHMTCTNLIPFDWQAGEDSSSHGVMLTRSDANLAVIPTSDANQVGFKFSNNGGGRHWGLQPEGSMIESQTDDPSYRHLGVFNTSEPLSLYGFNCEKVSGGNFACEISQASNVDLYNVKAETCGQCADTARKTANQILLVNDTDNVNVIGYSGNARPGDDSTANSLAAIVIDNGATVGLTMALVNPNTDEFVSEACDDDGDDINANCDLDGWATIRNNISATDITGPHIGSYVEEDK